MDGPRLQFAIDAWLTRVSTGTRETFRNPLRRFTEWCASDHVSWSRASEDDVVRFLVTVQRERELAPSTMQVYRSALRSFYKYGIEQGWVSQMPLPQRKPWGGSQTPIGVDMREAGRTSVGEEADPQPDPHQRNLAENRASDGLVEELLELIGLPATRPATASMSSDHRDANDPNAAVVLVQVPVGRLQEVSDLLASTPRDGLPRIGSAPELSGHEEQVAAEEDVLQWCQELCEEILRGDYDVHVSVIAEVATARSAVISADLSPWSEELLRTMYRESSATLRRFFDHLANAPGEFVSAHDLAKAIALRSGTASLGGILGALGNRCSNRYDRDVPYMMEWRETAAGTGRSYSMSSEVAAVLRSCGAAYRQATS